MATCRTDLPERLGKLIVWNVLENLECQKVIVLLLKRMGYNIAYNIRLFSASISNVVTRTPRPRR